ncbi:MAG: ubiquinone biosynthesis protein UbiJ [Cryomorphaceae bacterium]|jgi:ubiquinone biosynthesis protein UbiJ
MLLELLELAGNSALEHDPNTRARIDKLQGKTMILHIQSIEQSLCVSPRPEGLEFSNADSENADVRLSASIGALIKISRDGMDNADLQPGELEIVGDPIVGQRFAQLVAQLDVDWEAALAEQIGDSPARLVTVVAGQVKELAQASQSSFKQFVNRLLKDDLKLVADKHDVEPFLDDVDTLRADADRLMIRVKRLQDKRTSD